jgi:hypothetical protein
MAAPLFRPKAFHLPPPDLWLSGKSPQTFTLKSVEVQSVFTETIQSGAPMGASLAIQIAMPALSASLL